MSQIGMKKSTDSRMEEESRGKRLNLRSNDFIILTENEAGLDGRFVVIVVIPSFYSSSNPTSRRMRKTRPKWSRFLDSVFCHQYCRKEVPN